MENEDAGTLDLIASLQLEKHPEGGWFREVYRSEETCHVSRAEGAVMRPLATSIYYLLPQGEASRLHRLQSDELWYHHRGASMRIHEITPEGEYRRHVLGGNMSPVSFQALIPAGSWFGAEPGEEGAYALVGCVVAPGFDFADFEMGSRKALLEAFPTHQDLVTRLTSP